MNSKDWEAKSLVGGIYPPIPPPGSATGTNLCFKDVV